MEAVGGAGGVRVAYSSCLDLAANSIGDEGVDRLAVVLGDADLYRISIGDGGAGRLAEVQGQCRLRAYLNRGSNTTRDEGAGRLADVLEE